MTDQSQPNVGGRIRSLRERQGLSLRALAERCGLSINAISRIERGENSPTVSSLHLLATALNVPITDFFKDQLEQATVFVKSDQRLRYQRNGFTMESLGIGLRNQQLEPFLFSMEPGTGNTDEPVTHSGQEFVYCLAGIIEYRVGDEIFVLETGDSLMLESSQPHCFRNVAETKSAFLIVYQSSDGSPVGHRVHLES